MSPAPGIAIPAPLEFDPRGFPRSAVRGAEGLPVDVDMLLREPALVRGLTARQRRELGELTLRRLQARTAGTAEYSALRGLAVELHMPLVRHLAVGYLYNRDSAEDVLQVGVLGLIKAINRYRPQADSSFAAYAVPTVLGEIKRFFRDATWPLRVPRRMSDLRAPLRQAQNELTTRLGWPPTHGELAVELGVEEAVVREAAMVSHSYFTMSLDAGSTDGPASEHDQTLAHRLGHHDHGFELVEARQTLARVIAELPLRERQILSMRFVDDLTQRQIGERLGISQVHVSRLLDRALRHMRHALIGDQAIGHATTPGGASRVRPRVVKAARTVGNSC